MQLGSAPFDWGQWVYGPFLETQVKKLLLIGTVALLSTAALAEDSNSRLGIANMAINGRRW
jgi:hypothetical protein